MQFPWDKVESQYHPECLDKDDLLRNPPKLVVIISVCNVIVNSMTKREKWFNESDVLK